MIRAGLSRLLLIPLASLAIPLAVIGCNDVTPSVSSSTEEVTVKGTVTYKGKKVTKGSITFDPANVKRKMASAVSSPIDAGGNYTIKTMVGENQVSFALPEYSGAADRPLGYLRLPTDVASDGATIDFDLPPKL
jgi:hypothetical protein